jgi:hypothetical protein
LPDILTPQTPVQTARPVGVNGLNDVLRDRRHSGSPIFVLDLNFRGFYLNVRFF